MNLSTILRQGVRTLLRNRMRSFLTILGIAVGIGAVVCVVAIGRAGSAQIEDRLNNLGENLVWIEAGGRQVNGVRTGTGSTKTLIYADEAAILRDVPLLKACSPQVDAHAQVVYGNQNWSTTYRGGSPEYLDIKRWRIASGAAFDADAVDRAADVLLIGQTVKNVLFGDEDPIGKVIRMNNSPFTVIGTLYPKGMSGMGGDQDDTVILPWTTAQRKIKGITWLDDILCSAVSPDAVKLAGAQAAVILRERHHIREGMDDDFNVRNPEDIIQAQLDASRTLSLFLISVSAVSLVVGGIGIMNVMLVSVTERTREIGVRMAVGATDAQVLIQFLGEAVMLCLAGGLAGLMLGLGGIQGLSRAMQWPMQLTPIAVVIAGAFSIAVGVFFGYYPARKAALLDPIEALRYE